MKKLLIVLGLVVATMILGIIIYQNFIIYNYVEKDKLSTFYNLYRNNGETVLEIKYNVGTNKKYIAIASKPVSKEKLYIYDDKQKTISQLFLTEQVEGEPIIKKDDDWSQFNLLLFEKYKNKTSLVTHFKICRRFHKKGKNAYERVIME